jgi:hypothetical protein
VGDGLGPESDGVEELERDAAKRSRMRGAEGVKSVVGMIAH